MISIRGQSGSELKTVCSELGDILILLSSWNQLSICTDKSFIINIY